MSIKSLQRVAAFLLLSGCLVITLPEVSANSTLRSAARTTNARAGAARASAQTKYKVGRALDLNLLQCTGEIGFPSAGISADALEISGGIVSLTSGGTVLKRGEVIAYAQSEYFLDSNVAFIFDRSEMPTQSAAWKPPVIISLNLRQDRKNPKRLALTSLPIDDSPVTRIALSCGSADATLK